MNSIRCRQCEHYIEANAGEGKIYGCDRSKCVFEPTAKCDSKFCPDRKVKTTNMETILHCIENECVAYKDGKCLKYNSDQESTIKNDLALIHTEGLDEEIRCTMCTNYMKSDRGCDGSCVVNKDMYKAVMDAIEKRIQPTTKNDLPHCQHTDEEIAKSFIEDVEAVKDQLPCFCEQMDFPNTFDEFAEVYGFKDKDEVYTNGAKLIPVFRVKQWLEHISTTKNGLGVDCISRKAALDITWHDPSYSDPLNVLTEIRDKIRELPSVTPQEPRWIPVSEKKPNKGGEYLLWGKIDESEEQDYCFIGDYYEFEEVFGIEESNYDPHTLGFIGTEIEEYYSVVAWMPLPQPYSEVEE